MAGKSTWIINKALDFMLRGGSWTPAGTLYLMLYTVMPPNTATAASGSGGTEVAGPVGATGYQRQSITVGTVTAGGTFFSATQGGNGAGAASTAASSPGVVANMTGVSFGVPVTTWGTVVGFGLTDAVGGSAVSGTAGNLWYTGTLGSPVLVYAGGPPIYFPAGSLAISEA